MNLRRLRARNRRRALKRLGALRAGLGPALSRGLRRLAFALAPLAAALGLAELSARLLWDRDDSAGLDALHEGMEMQAHRTRMWTLRPGTRESFGAEIAIDPDGLRTVEETGADLRALTLGDSSVFGHGLEHPDTLHAGLQAALAERGVQLDALCGAIPGYSTEQTLLLLDEAGWDLDPDLLVVGNLWSDNNFDTFVDREWLAALHVPERQIDLALRSISDAWSWLRAVQSDEDDADQTVHAVSWIRDPYESGRRRVALSHYAANLDRLLAAAGERGVSAIVLQPVNRDRLRGVTPATWDPYFVAQARIAARRQVPIVDGLEVLRAGGLDVEAAFLDEMHPTGPANRLYAEALADALIAAGWPDEPAIPSLDVAPFDEALQDVWSEPLAPYQEGIVPTGPPPQGPRPN